MNPTVRTGAIVLALFDLIIIVFPLATGAPAEELALGLGLGILILIALAMWFAGRARRVAMCVAVVLSALSALLAIPPIFFPDVPAWVAVLSVVYIVGVVVGIVLVRGELVGRTSPVRA